MSKKNINPSEILENAVNTEITTEQKLFGGAFHVITLISFFTALLAPIIVLLFSNSDGYNVNRIFYQIFNNQSPSQIWKPFVDFSKTGFWAYFSKNIFTPVGVSYVALMVCCSSAFFALIFPAAVFAKQKKWVILFTTLIVMILIALSLSGIIKG